MGTTIIDLEGAEEIFEIKLFLHGNPFRTKKFPSTRQINFFSLGKASQNIFFPGECLSKLIFSLRVPLRIYFSRILPLPLKIVFFLEKGLRNYFFLDFLRPHPQIITGRPLSVFRNILGVLRNVLRVLRNNRGVLRNVQCVFRNIFTVQCTWSIGSIGCIGGADRTFPCKSQECLWQDWYIC